MIKYIFKRLLLGVVTLFILATFTQDNKVLSAETYAAMEAKYGLDKPVGEQYVIYLKNALHGDFGESISKKGQQVSSIIVQRFPVTAQLGVIAFAFSMIFGISFGIISALTKYRWVNSLITVMATLGVSIPGFLLAMMLMILFGVKLGWLPIVGLSDWKSYIMPSLALSFGALSTVTRLTRSSLRDVMGSDYITLARSKGTKEIWVIIKHGLKNALLPVITYAGPMFASLITGSLVIETLFSIPGIGKEFTSSISNRDYTLCMGLTIFFGLLVIIMNLVSDIAAAIVDPRIKLGK